MSGQPESGGLSVCVMAYNEEEYIGRCLDSILVQDGVYIQEILVGVNGSTDGTVEIVERYRRRDSRIRIIDSPKGKAHAWNAVNAVAANNLRLFQDADCYSAPDTFARLIAELECYDLVGASLHRRTETKPVIPFIMHFPKRYVSPHKALSGCLYALRYDRVREALLESTGAAAMPVDIINDDAFLQAAVKRTKVSHEIFVDFEVAQCWASELSRQKRMRIGNYQLRHMPATRPRMSPGQFVLRKIGATHKMFWLASPQEKLLFPFVLVAKFCMYRVMELMSLGARLGDRTDWDHGEAQHRPELPKVR